MVTPALHRVHHAINPEYIDKNFGNLLIIWDRMFGTFASERNKVIYGIKENVKTFNPIKITFMFWIKMINDFRNSKTVREKFLCFFGFLEWEPKNINNSK